MKLVFTRGGDTFEFEGTLRDWHHARLLLAGWLDQDKTLRKLTARLTKSTNALEDAERADAGTRKRRS